MNSTVILELAAKWERNNAEPMCEDGSDAGKLQSAEARGHRKAMAQAAEDLRTLVRLLSDPPPIGWGQYGSVNSVRAGRAIGAENRRA